MKPIILVVPGEPQGKQRARPRGDGRGVYTPAKSANYEKLIVGLFTEAYPGFEMLEEEAVVLRITAFYAIPKSKSAAKKGLMAVGVVKPTKRPDVDNILKSVMDELQGWANRDDAQEVWVQIFKQYSEKPRLDIRLSLEEDEINEPF